MICFLLPDIEGDAERELENRMADEVDDQGFYAQLRKKARSTIVSAAGKPLIDCIIAIYIDPSS